MLLSCPLLSVLPPALSPAPRFRAGVPQPGVRGQIARTKVHNFSFRALAPPFLLPARCAECPRARGLLLCGRRGRVCVFALWGTEVFIPACGFSPPSCRFCCRLAAFAAVLPAFCCRGYGLFASCRDMYTKKKNRTLALSGRGTHFYVSLTTNLSRAAAERGFRSAEMYFVATGIGPGATGILGVFPACTPRRRYMYILGLRKSLIVNTAKERVCTGCISSLFSTQR